MSYTGRKNKYKSRREKAQEINRNARMIKWIVIIFIAALAFYKRIDIIDYINTYFR